MPDEELWKNFISSQPSSAKFTDFAGNIRIFNFSGYLTNGYTVVAKETVDSDQGYEFSAFSYSSPHEAMSNVVSKIRTSLATRNLDPHNFPHLIAHQCVGRVAHGGVVVDGEFVAWEKFTEMMQSYEGWEFSLDFGDT
ncbi:DUF7713 domain-containing protein [Pseudoxanthomonas mexicana]